MSKSPDRSREIRVFLSSTFKDMEEEREHLLGRIFPGVRKACATRGVTFTEIDLRWGVSEEDSKNGRTVEICLEEINRSREYPPFFIGFLGERYGWIPTREDLESYWKGRQESPYRMRIEQALEEGISVTELEMEYGILDRETERDHSLVLLRSPELTKEFFTKAGAPSKDYYDEGGGEDGGERKLTRLKDRLRQSGLVGLDGYQSLEEFGKAVEDFLLAGLEAYFPESEENTQEDSRDRSHALYAWSRREGYVPLEMFRDEVWEKITQEGGSSVLQVVGESGLGKSAFLADLEEWIPTQMQDDPWIFAHYIGVDGDRSLSGWRDRLFRRLEREGLLQAEGIPSEEAKRWEFLPEALFRAQNDCKWGMILLLDAVDQVLVKEELENLRLLQRLPKVRIILTGTPESELSFGEILRLRPLDRQHRERAIEKFLQRYSKKLDEALLTKLVETNTCAVPLYLRLLLEELRLHASHETLRSWTDELLKEKEAGSLFLKVLAGIDRDLKAEGLPTLGSRGARLMAASRRGLRRGDLAVLLNKGQSSSRLPDQLLSPVLIRLEPFCLNDNGRFYIMHALLRNRLLEEEESAGIRKDLIEHPFEEENERVAERLYQWNELKDERGVSEILGDLDQVMRSWKYDPKLLEVVLLAWGAGKNDISPLLSQVSQGWKKHLADRTKDLPDEIDQFGNWLAEKSFLKILEPLLEGILKWRRRHLPSGHLDISVSLNNLGTLYRDQGGMREAEPLLEEALEISRASLPANHPYISVNLNNLGTLYQSQGRMGEAESLYKEALEILRASLPANHPHIARSLNNLGTLYRDQGGMSEAEPLLEEALEISRASLPANHPDIARSLNNLAILYQAQGRMGEAEPLYKEALEISRASLPANHPDIARNLSHLASLYQAQGRMGEAEPLLEEALEISRASLPANHPDIATGLKDLATLYRAQGRMSEAEPLLEEALEISRASLPANHPDIATSLSHLSGLYWAQGRMSEAEPLLEEALEISRASLPANHPDIAVSLINLGTLYQAQGRMGEAESLYKEALEIRKAVLPVDHPDRDSPGC